jgi:hypothetical protein
MPQPFAARRKAFTQKRKQRRTDHPYWRRERRLEPLQLSRIFWQKGRFAIFFNLES